MSTKTSKIAQTIKFCISEALSSQNGKRCGIALSGGVDSCSIFAEALDQKTNPLILSYTPRTHYSTDFRMARDAAKKFGCEFIPVRVPMTADFFEKGMRYVISRGYHSKIEIESLVPIVMVLKHAVRNGVEVLFTGDQADGYFNNSKSAVITLGVRDHTDSGTVDYIRSKYYEKDSSCSGAIRKLGIELGLKDVICPYRDLRIYKAFQGALWTDVNKPRTKEPIRLAYDHIFDQPDGFPTRPFPVNLHKGDSEFGDTMGKTLLSLPKFSRYKSPRGLYNAVHRGEA